MVIISHDGDILRNAVSGVLQLIHELVCGFIAIADECGWHILRKGELREYVALVRAVADHPILAQRNAVLKQRLVISEISVLNAAGGADTSQKPNAAVAVFDKVARQHVRSIEVIGKHCVCVLAAAVEIQENRGELVADKLADVLVGKLSQHDKSVHLVVKYGIRDLLHAVVVVDNLKHAAM